MVAETPTPDRRPELYFADTVSQARELSIQHNGDFHPWPFGGYVVEARRG